MERAWPKRFVFDDNEPAPSDEEDHNESDAEEPLIIPARSPTPEVDDEDNSDPEVVYDRIRAKEHNKKSSGYGGWEAELRAYHRDTPESAKKETDLCAYWAVS